ncbi:MAG: SMC-Scp complex subunit ScpB [candidate division Zixibacteria bacterium]|nr:SMC-Scp complex subunit ScpB [candidate division Zixibacteria bacterium]
MEKDNKRAVVEALILASPEPINAKRISESDSALTPGKVARAVLDLNISYEEIGASFRIREVAGGYQFYILPDFSRYVDVLFTRRRKLRLTRAAMETLAIVAYKQPVSKVDIEHIRGVSSDGVLHNLLEKKLVNIKGRSESAGRALQYATTDEFLKFFGLNELEDLPQMSEIEEILKSSQPDEIDELNVESDVVEDNQTIKPDESINGNIQGASTTAAESEEQEGLSKVNIRADEEVNRVSMILENEEESES